MTLPIHEQFYTFQGEGAHAGRAAYFIRTFGCPVHCPWCDSAGTWHPDYIPKQIQRLSAEALAAEVAQTQAECTVITGGEPAIHDLNPLTDALHAIGQPTHLETSGAFPIRGTFDWITLSPKRWKLPLDENVTRANEFKLIIDRPEAIDEYVSAPERARRSTHSRQHRLAPPRMVAAQQPRRAQRHHRMDQSTRRPLPSRLGNCTKTTLLTPWTSAARHPPPSAVIHSKATNWPNTRKLDCIDRFECALLPQRCPHTDTQTLATPPLLKKAHGTLWKKT